MLHGVLSPPFFLFLSSLKTSRAPPRHVKYRGTLASCCAKVPSDRLMTRIGAHIGNARAVWHNTWICHLGDTIPAALRRESVRPFSPRGDLSELAHPRRERERVRDPLARSADFSRTRLA